MFSPFSRLLILIICAVLSIVGAIYGIWSLLIISTMLSIGILWGYFNVGTIYLALGKMRKNEFSNAEKLLELVKNPDRLNNKNQAYFYFIRGIIAHEEDRLDEARICLDKSLSVGIRNEADRAMALLALADVALINKQEEAARAYFTQIRNLKVNPNLMPSIRKMQEWLEI